MSNLLMTDKGYVKIGELLSLLESVVSVCVCCVCLCLLCLFVSVMHKSMFMIIIKHSAFTKRISSPFQHSNVQMAVKYGLFVRDSNL